jgi:UDPglucose--hexose-1-phosphate uridylyltransferase
MVWEERWHPLRREWVVISSHRDRRPWQGETVNDASSTPVAYDPGCYLCPGNARVSGQRNPAYTGAGAVSRRRVSEPPRGWALARGMLLAAT